MNRREFLLATAALSLPLPATASGLDQVNLAEAAQAVRESLSLSAKAALAKLGRADGYFANPKVRIGLHKNLAKAERLLRSMGYGVKLDDMVKAMNRAAEQAIPKAEPLLLNMVRKLGIEDAKAILGGGSDAVTTWFRKGSEAQLQDDLQPLIHSVVEQSDLARAHAAMSKVLARWNISGDLPSIEAYVSRKALDGLYTSIADEERALRASPAKYAGGLVGKIYELLK
jgi:hypothetical protein